MFDRWNEECGLFGVWNHREAANLVYLGLYAQQHRGQEGAGVVASSRNDKDSFHMFKGLGLVSDVFSEFDFNKLPGERAIGHVRYSTAGGHHLANVQPFYAEIALGKVALAHNGNLINIERLREKLIGQGAIFGTTSDSEIILHLLSRTKSATPLIERVIEALSEIKGAYSLLLLFEDRMIVVRDPNGFRPLALGSLNGSLLVASETCAFDLVGAKYIRDINPGEVLEISGDCETKSYYPFGTVRETPCIFEYVYFARPDSSIFGQNVYLVRKRMGEELAKLYPVKADLVVPVPDSGVTAALGYSAASGIPLELGLIRNHYVGRTFIEPKQSIRDFGVKIKLNANTHVLKDKSIVVVDDSLVRGTTSKKLVKIFRDAGAKEVHLRISSPPITDPCFYGIDTPEKDELIASHKSVEEIAEYIGVDSLQYLSIDGLMRAVNSVRGKFCDACFTGQYPIGGSDRFAKKQQPLF